MLGQLAYAQGGPADNGYAWLEKIENGTLVHYVIAIKHRTKVNSIHGFPPLGEESHSFGNPNVNEVMEYYTRGKRTVYCKTIEEVFATIKVADDAKLEIDRLERDGKFDGTAFKASS